MPNPNYEYKVMRPFHTRGGRSFAKGEVFAGREIGRGELRQSWETGRVRRIGNAPVTVDTECKAIETAGIGTRAVNALLKAGIKTLGELREFDLSDVAKLPGIGQAALRRIEDLK